ncbi:uncharacterized protein LOC144907104 [Branchiostoma floridae x Branchiostoma belcheri]
MAGPIGILRKIFPIYPSMKEIEEEVECGRKSYKRLEETLNIILPIIDDVKITQIPTEKARSYENALTEVESCLRAVESRIKTFNKKKIRKVRNRNDVKINFDDLNLRLTNLIPVLTLAMQVQTVHRGAATLKKVEDDVLNKERWEKEDEEDDSKDSELMLVLLKEMKTEMETMNKEQDKQEAKLEAINKAITAHAGAAAAPRTDSHPQPQPAGGSSERPESSQEGSEEMDLDTFYRAVEKGDVQTVRRGLDAGVGVKVKRRWQGRDDMTSLHVASWYGKTEVVELLLKHGADLEARTKDDMTALHVASGNGETKVAAFLLKHGADLEARDVDGLTSLHVASQYRRTEVVELLLKHGADLEARDVDGLTSLHVASQYRRTEVVELLLKHGADLEARDVGGMTSLHVASGNGRTEVAALLIEHGADLEARDEGGMTSLHVASGHGHTEVVELLIKHGANLEARGEDGQTALQVASQYRRTEVAALLTKHGANQKNRQPQMVDGHIKLDLSNQGLTSIPEEVFDITDLEVLDVSNNKLTSIPEAIGRLQKLTILYIESNQLTEVPPGVCSLSNLEVLSVGSNPIRYLPDDVRRLTRLKTLSIRSCKFEKFPRQVLQLKTLEKLHAGGCTFDTIPDEVGTLQHLWFLSLKNNLLRALPSTMSHLHNLRKVYLHDNKFDTFPEVLCELPAMEKLDISNNNITRLPTTLHRADKLKDLDVSGNPLTYPPKDVCAQGTRVIMTFMKQEAEKEVLQTFNRLSVRMKQTQWKPLARSLGFNNSEIKSIIKASAPDNVYDQVYQTLVQWREKAGEAATLPALQQHLRDLGFHQLAEQLPHTPGKPTVGGQEPDELLNRYSVTVDRRFPIVEFARLEEQSILGRGGFAYVMKARHLDWRQDVAVKCLLTGKLQGSEQDQVYSEARKLNLGSRSEYVISLKGVCLDPNVAIVMPYMENGSLAGLLRDVDVPWALRWRMAHEISLGMTFLHCQNPQILHCDLKAENVLLDGDFHVKVSDFGMSKWKAKSCVQTKTSPVGGTVTHMPPECLKDINYVPTDKFDVYSFGVLLWEIITRRQPYENAANSALMKIQVQGGQRPDLTLIPTDREDVTSVSELMQTCWSQNPEDRPTFQDCAAQLQPVKDRFSRKEMRLAIISMDKTVLCHVKKCLSSEEGILQAIITVKSQKKVQPARSIWDENVRVFPCNCFYCLDPLKEYSLN